MALADATKLAVSRNLITRIVEINGKYQAVTDDYSPSRVNFAIRNNRVTRTSRG